MSVFASISLSVKGKKLNPPHWPPCDNLHVIQTSKPVYLHRQGILLHASGEQKAPARDLIPLTPPELNLLDGYDVLIKSTFTP